MIHTLVIYIYIYIIYTYVHSLPECQMAPPMKNPSYATAKKCVCKISEQVTSEFEKSFVLPVLPVLRLSERSNQMKTIVHRSSALRFVYADL